MQRREHSHTFTPFSLADGKRILEDTPALGAPRALHRILWIAQISCQNLTHLARIKRLQAKSSGL
ncbi:MAG TPA: hypothetical protein VMB73_36075 [Acetobacteraceae bacterium]|nr:hypothetical protein [Acetobacteraceae bacterium]